MTLVPTPHDEPTSSAASSCAAAKCGLVPKADMYTSVPAASPYSGPFSPHSLPLSLTYRIEMANDAADNHASLGSRT